jgi:16S rRNA (cytidine1402-2'-O)-methyltransferase
LPRKAGERARRLAELRDEPRTLVFFEAPHRTPATLTALAQALGADRAAAACRELTKTHEEVRRGRLDELAEWAQAGVRGEVTLVVAGAEPTRASDDPVELASAVAAQQAGGLSRRDAIAAVTAATGLPRRVVYQAAHGGTGEGVDSSVGSRGRPGGRSSRQT